LVFCLVALTATVIGVCLFALGDTEGLKLCLQTLCVLGVVSLVGMWSERDARAKDSQCMTHTRL
jgi:uncharacterized membrane protein YqjE